MRGSIPAVWRGTFQRKLQTAPDCLYNRINISEKEYTGHPERSFSTKVTDKKIEPIYCNQHLKDVQAIKNQMKKGGRKMASRKT
ncbi:MAG: hypothetical protein UHU22_05060, partial [Ruminococcus sp.]|nr:hypothetical protein [Ruminococcus sp.]